MSKNTARFDNWIRTGFVALNTALEHQYWQLEDKANIAAVDAPEKQRLLREGNTLITALLDEGNTNEGFDSAFDLLGNVGLFMAACRRHELTEPSREQHSPLLEASALAMQIGASIGMAPRFSTAHLTTHNRALDGVSKRFSELEDEKTFIDYNTKSILAYKRAADALLRVQPLGISHPLVADLFINAREALEDVVIANRALAQQLDAERFFYCVRPYFKPYRVGEHVYRGANAGDFAGINVIDLQLGLCFANEQAYSQLLVDKFLYMMPEDQHILRVCMRRPSIMDDFLLAKTHYKRAWYQHNLALFLEVCRSHGKTAIQHHNQLVSHFIVKPAKAISGDHLEHVTASGPPLEVVLAQLERLKDQRAALPRQDIRTRHGDIEQLQALLK